MVERALRFFIKDHENVTDPKVRTAYGAFAAIVGIVCNLLLFAGKLTAGILGRSISVVSDAFNNLSDALSSVISLVGVRLAAKPADREHPYGHGRIEYIAAFVVAFLVVEVGISFMKSSVERISHPELLTTGNAAMIFLCFSVAVKIWLSFFYRKLAKKIGSGLLEATAADARGDVLATAATIISCLLFRFRGINIDGYIGFGVSCIIIWAGIGICRETLAPLIGEPASAEERETIRKIVESYDGIFGTHDLQLHHYGPSRTMASIHAEMDCRRTVGETHQTVDRIERHLKSELGIDMVIHVDPVNTTDPLVLQKRRLIKQILKGTGWDLHMHDLQVEKTEDGYEIAFDLAVPYDMSQDKIDMIIGIMRETLAEKDARTRYHITIDKEE